MATGVASWSQTASSNSNADSAVNWAEGQAPSTVNDSARALMASVAKWRDDIEGSLASGGTSTAYTATSNQSFASLSALDGHKLSIKFGATNGSSPTLAVDGLTAKPLQIDASTAIASGLIVSGSVWDLTYNNSAGAFLVHAPPTATPSFTSLTVSGAIVGGTVSAGGMTAATFAGGSFVGSTVSTSGNLNIGGTLTFATLASGNLASQSDQETGTSTTAFVTPGRQHFHASASKCWIMVDNGATIPTNGSYNVTSATDASTGLVTITIATDFGSANYAVIPGVSHNTNLAVKVLDGTQAAGSIQLSSVTASTNVSADPNNYYAAMFGKL